MTIAIWGILPAHAQNKIFRKYGDIDNVEYVCITRPMLKLMGSNASTTINGVHIDGIADVLKTILIINTDNGKVCSQMDDDFEQLRDNPSYEVFMEVKLNDEHMVTMVSKTQADKELIMFIRARNSDERTFIVITGKFTDEQIAKLLDK